MLVNIKKLCFSYGDKKIFQDFDLNIDAGSVTCIMGGSGAGKTTLLNCISGLLNYSGEIEIQGENSQIAYVFQQPRLIPSMSVEDNVRLVLPASADKNAVQRRIDDIIAKLKLEDCRKSYPRNISGGQASRAAIARAAVTDADIFLMDEPFKGLDIKLKKEIIQMLIPLLKDKTAIFVTHDVEEALAIADRVCILDRSQGQCVNLKGVVDIDMSRDGRDVYSEKSNELRQKIYSML